MKKLTDNVRKNNKKVLGILVIIIIAIMILIGEIQNDINSKTNINNSINGISQKDTFKIISSDENKNLEEILKNYAEKNEINLAIEYAGSIEIMDKLNQGEKYDAVWMSNSIWLYMLNNNIKISNSKSTSINPVVFGITKSTAEKLGFIGKEIYTKDILEAIKNGDLKFNMSSATRTNTGATAFLGFLSTIAGNPEVLTENNLQDDVLKQELTTLLSGVTRSSGSDEFLEDMFLSGTYDAVITYETSIINMNKKLEAQGKDILYAIYPIDGVSISDSPLAYIDNGDKDKLDIFKQIQGYILSDEGQTELVKTGRRVWYGGTNSNADKTIFNPNWGIDTTKYIVPVKYPSVAVIKKALALYQTELRKPVHTVFCLDYSGSMYGTGINELINAMEYILTEEKASENLLQFSSKDKISIVPFSREIYNEWQTEDGTKTDEIIKKIKKQSLRR